MDIRRAFRWKATLALFKFQRLIARWNVRVLDYPKKRILINTHNIREYMTRARSVAKEPRTVAWIERVASPGAVLYDVGANVGAYSLIAAALGMRVVAFEPSPSNIGSLGHNAFLNNLQDKISILSVALSDAPGTIAFPIADPTAGSSMGVVRGAAGSRTEVFESATLDQVRVSLALPTPTAIKIDIDGGEALCLNGAVETLASPALKSVLVECADETKSTVMSQMQEAGFSLIEDVRMDDHTYNMVWDRT